MSTLPLEEHSLYEREQLARINATPAAPESFDPIVALRRVEAAVSGFGNDLADVDPDALDDLARQRHLATITFHTKLCVALWGSR